MLLSTRHPSLKRDGLMHDDDPKLRQLCRQMAGQVLLESQDGVQVVGDPMGDPVCLEGPRYQASRYA